MPHPYRTALARVKRRRRLEPAEERDAAGDLALVEPVQDQRDVAPGLREQREVGAVVELAAY